MVPLQPHGRTHSSFGASSSEARQTQQVRGSSAASGGGGGIGNVFVVFDIVLISESMVYSHAEGVFSHSARSPFNTRNSLAFFSHFAIIGLRTLIRGERKRKEISPEHTKIKSVHSAEHTSADANEPLNRSTLPRRQGWWSVKCADFAHVMSQSSFPSRKTRGRGRAHMFFSNSHHG